MLLTSFNDSCKLAIVLELGSFEMVFRRLSRFSLPVVVVELPLLALNDEQMDALPNELYAIVLNRLAGSVSTTLLLFDVDGCSVSSLQKKKETMYKVNSLLVSYIKGGIE